MWGGLQNTAPLIGISCLFTAIKMRVQTEVVREEYPVFCQQHFTMYRLERRRGSEPGELRSK
jgi:hypothetical protein